MKSLRISSLACILLVGLLSCHVRAAAAAAAAAGEAGAQATKQPTLLSDVFSRQKDDNKGRLVAAASVRPVAYRGKVEKEHVPQSYSGPSHSSYPGTASNSIQQNAQDSYNTQSNYKAQNSYTVQNAYNHDAQSIQQNAMGGCNANPGYPPRTPEAQSSQSDTPSAYSVVPGANQVGRYQSAYNSKTPSQGYAEGNAAAKHPGNSQGMYGNSQGPSYAADSYKYAAQHPAAGSYGSLPYAQAAAPYKQPYGVAYQPGPEDPHSYTLTQPKEPYIASYQAPGAAYTPHTGYGMGSEYAEYPDAASINPSRGYAMPQQPFRGVNKVTAEDTGSKASKAAAKQHHPTVVHQDDPYKQQQLQQQQVLNALGNSNALANAVLGNTALANAVLGNAALGNAGLGNAGLGSGLLANAALGGSVLGNSALGGGALGGGALGGGALGSSGYGGLYKQPTNPSGPSNIQAAADPDVQLWWKDHGGHQQLQPTQKQPGSTALDKLDALVSIINKLGN